MVISAAWGERGMGAVWCRLCILLKNTTMHDHDGGSGSVFWRNWTRSSAVLLDIGVGGQSFTTSFAF